MDHSYSTEREKVQKADHSYFTIAKKTPKVVLRRAQLLKELQNLNHTSICQDHSYVRSDHLPSELINNDVVNDQDNRLLQMNAQTHQSHKESKQPVSDSSKAKPSSSIPPVTCSMSAYFSTETPEPSICDLDCIDAQINGIKLDHTYDLKLNTSANRRSSVSSERLEMMDLAVMCCDPISRLRLQDHTYLRRSGLKVLDKA